MALVSGLSIAYSPALEVRTLVRPALPRCAAPLACVDAPKKPGRLSRLFHRFKSSDGGEDFAAAADTATAAEPVAPAEPAELSIVERVDELHAANSVIEMFDLLTGADVSDDEIAWRSARAHHDLAEETVDDATRREQLLRDGLAIAEAVVARSPDNGYGHKWFGILLGRLGDFLPTKEKVANSFRIKEALDAAGERLPADPSVQTALGQWCLKVAGISWVERNAAKLLFGAPPESSYDEALAYFEASHAIRPSKKASLQAGLALQKLNQRDRAVEWLEGALALPGSGEADADLDRQARTALGK